MNSHVIDKLIQDRLSREFYADSDVTEVARNLIGKRLCTYIDNSLTVGKITETEAYCGRNDQACHANNGFRTDRTEVMYGSPGHAYIYLCYGIHHLFNVVTNHKELADAVLIRSIEPLLGIETMLLRREREVMKPDIVNGPGKLTQALGITTGLNGVNLTGDLIWISDSDETPDSITVESSTRIGVDYAGSASLYRWRYTVVGGLWLSR